MKKYTVILLMVLFVFGCSKEKQNSDFRETLLNRTQTSIDYHIKRTDYTKGTYKTFSYELRNDSIAVTRYSTNDLPPKILYSHILNAKQKSRLLGILNSFDLRNMKNEYINKNIEGEGHSVYDIRINKDFKSIYVYFIEEPDIKKLDNFINEILPANQNGWHDSY